MKLGPQSVSPNLLRRQSIEKTKNKGIVPQSNELSAQSLSPNLLRRQSVEKVTLFFSRYTYDILRYRGLMN